MPGKRSTYDIYSWEPSLSPHKISFLSALSRCPEVSSVTYVSAAGLSEDRARQGWRLPSTEDLRVVQAPTLDQVDDIVTKSPPASIHLFSGVHWMAMFKAGLEAAIRSGRTFGLMSEPRASELPGGLARLAHSWMTEGAYRRHADFVLAIGRNGPPWFRAAGYPANRVFPFAYFVPLSDENGALPRSSKLPTIAYLGRLDQTKGLGFMLEAAKAFDGRAHFVIAGDGAMRADVEVAHAAGTVSYLGPIPMTETGEFLKSADIVCAPSTSTDDGWCAVVSEALLSGAAVLTTPKVGASICIQQDARLGIVVAPTPTAVIRALDKQISAIDDIRRHRAWRKEWSEQRLTPEAGAAYMVSILDHITIKTASPSPFFI